MRGVDIEAKMLSQSAWEALYLQHARGERDDLMPFPEPDVQRLTNSAEGEDTARDAVSILNAALSLAAALRSRESLHGVLDFGCGWGRMTRLLPFYFPSETVKGVDVDARLINSANSLFPDVEHLLIVNGKPLPFTTASFDLVLANSVFSHLSEQGHRHAITEIARVLKPGGMALLSILDSVAVQRFYASDAQRDWISGLLGDEQQLVTALQQTGFQWGGTGRWADYGIAVATEAWVTRFWADVGLSLKRTQRGEHRRAQLFCLAQRVQG